MLSKRPELVSGRAARARDERASSLGSGAADKTSRGCLVVRRGSSADSAQGGLPKTANQGLLELGHLSTTTRRLARIATSATNPIESYGGHLSETHARSEECKNAKMHAICWALLRFIDSEHTELGRLIVGPSRGASYIN